MNAPAHSPENIRLWDGTRIQLRPIRPEDEAALAQFHQTLSGLSVHFRYFQGITLSQRTAHERLAGICTPSGSDLVIVAEAPAGAIAGVGRIAREEAGRAEFAIIISDAWQDHGLGSALMRHLITVAGREGVLCLHGSILAENAPMLDLCQRLGFQLALPEDGVIEASLDPRAAQLGENADSSGAPRAPAPPKS
jgi:acetyltransferase